MRYPTLAEWNAAVERAAQLGVRLLLVEGQRVELVRIADGTTAGTALSWEAAIEQLAIWETA
jgi:hypothetical protein